MWRRYFPHPYFFGIICFCVLKRGTGEISYGNLYEKYRGIVY
ncbi:hypothetical protein DF16_pBMB293orf00193 (plasmid) [Bacillus thuringiensis serovar kurstaki str. YBT-1520]|nr:hypothetical protein H175_285p265 [Bacillus thuringiensis serovar thuringiensis str. IS5056]AIM34717.1 hypothetical protein DF16_pBMB293orf00193 [Bacillus thuringiensis serovar kurstaki str. YBT-1520]